MKNLYILTDGEEYYDAKLMDKDEYQEASEHADDATDGTFYWFPMEIVEKIDMPEIELPF